MRMSLPSICSILGVEKGKERSLSLSGEGDPEGTQAQRGKKERKGDGEEYVEVEGSVGVFAALIRLWR